MVFQKKVEALLKGPLGNAPPGRLLELQAKMLEPKPYTRKKGHVKGSSKARVQRSMWVLYIRVWGLGSRAGVGYRECLSWFGFGGRQHATWMVATWFLALVLNPKP